MTLDWTVRVWELSSQRGDVRVLLLALSDGVDPSGQGMMPDRADLARTTAVPTDELDGIITRAVDAGELVWGLGEGVGRDRFVLTIGASTLDQRAVTPWGPRRARQLPDAGAILVARAQDGIYRGLTRIARAKDPDRRLAQLQRELHETSSLVREAAIPTSDMDGAKGYLGCLLAAWRIEHDWFWLPPDVRTWLRGLAALEPPAAEGREAEETDDGRC